MSSSEPEPLPTPAAPTTRWAISGAGAEAAASAAADRDLRGPSTRDEAMLALLSAAPQIESRPQFFRWTQGPLQALLPHDVLVCGAFQRSEGTLAYDCLNSIVLGPDAMDLLCSRRGLLLRGLAKAWVEGHCLPLALPLSQVPVAWAEGLNLLVAAGLRGLLVHGVSRPHRPDEIESLFVFAQTHTAAHADGLRYLAQTLPLIHAAWQRVKQAERKLTGASNAPAGTATTALARSVSKRERQILAAVRDGRSNAEIGQLLSISPLTVKNHVQNLLKKLGANNRAQAVAMAMTMQLLDNNRAPQGDEPGL